MKIPYTPKLKAVAVTHGKKMLLKNRNLPFENIAGKGKMLV